MSALPPDTGFEFPCEIPLVAFGPAGESFAQQVEQALIDAGGQRTESQVHVRASSGGRWQAVRVPLWVVDREQLQQLYAALSKVPGVSFKL
ncbi:MAG: DUF493 domain-containing protein [Xanthomonadales bacterium]|nr:DUF493 domain-containing protein [Xanthomonadales bacterium]